MRIIDAPFFITGETQEEFNRVKAAACKQIAFYGSTPAYRAVLESIGYGELQGELTGLSKQGKWVEMGELIDETLLNKLAIVGEPEQIADQVRQRFGDIFDFCSASVFTGEGYSAGGYNGAIGGALRGSDP